MVLWFAFLIAPIARSAWLLSGPSMTSSATPSVPPLCLRTWAPRHGGEFLLLLWMIPFLNLPVMPYRVHLAVDGFVGELHLKEVSLYTKLYQNWFFDSSPKSNKLHTYALEPSSERRVDQVVVRTCPAGRRHGHTLAHLETWDSLAYSQILHLYCLA